MNHDARPAWGTATLPEVIGENPSPTDAEIAAPHFACNVRVVKCGCQCTEISSRQTTNQQGIGVGPSTSRRPRGLHDSSIATAEKNFTKPLSRLARTATKARQERSTRVDGRLLGSGPAVDAPLSVVRDWVAGWAVSLPLWSWTSLAATLWSAVCLGGPRNEGRKDI